MKNFNLKISIFYILFTIIFLNSSNYVSPVCCHPVTIQCMLNTTISFTITKLCSDFSNPRWRLIGMNSCGVGECNVLGCACEGGCRQSLKSPPGWSPELSCSVVNF